MQSQKKAFNFHRQHGDVPTAARSDANAEVPINSPVPQFRTATYYWIQHKSLPRKSDAHKHTYFRSNDWNPREIWTSSAVFNNCKPCMNLRGSSEGNNTAPWFTVSCLPIIWRKFTQITPNGCRYLRGGFAWTAFLCCCVSRTPFSFSLDVPWKINGFLNAASERLLNIHYI